MIDLAPVAPMAVSAFAMNPSISRPGIARLRFRPTRSVARLEGEYALVASQAWASAARAVSVILLSLLPVLLWHRSLGPFTYAKNALLQLGGVAILAAAAGAAWGSGSYSVISFSLG